MNKFTEYRIVKEEDLDEMLHVNNVVYLQFLQEIAISHWYSVAPKKTIESIRWIVRKHEIEYLHPAQLGDKLKLQTWISSIGGVSSERLYEIYLGEKLVVKAKTTWIAVNPITQKPQRLDSTLKELFI